MQTGTVGRPLYGVCLVVRGEWELQVSSLAKRIAAIEDAIRLSARGTLELHRTSCDCTSDIAGEQGVRRFACGGTACAEHDARCHVAMHPSAQPGRCLVLRGGSWLGLSPAMTSNNEAHLGLEREGISEFTGS